MDTFLEMTFISNGEKSDGEKSLNYLLVYPVNKPLTAYRGTCNRNLNLEKKTFHLDKFQTLIFRKHNSERYVNYKQRKMYR